MLFIGSIKDEVIVDINELAVELIKTLIEKYPLLWQKRYQDAQTLEEIARKRGFIVAGGEPNEERAAAAVIDDFRKGRIGRITLD